MANSSIHPRNWYVEKVGYVFSDRRKKNTSEPRKLRATVERAIAGTQRHCVEHPNDGMAKANLVRLEGIIAAGNLR